MKKERITTSSIRLFNTPLEYGFRILFLLHATSPHSCDIQRLISYDYLLVHSGDAHLGPHSLHPSAPFRGTEWLVKREIIHKALTLMFSRGLLCKELTEEKGFLYRASKLTEPFLKLLNTSYAHSLSERALWVHNTFGTMNDEKLHHYMTQKAGQWGTEFVRLTALRDLKLEEDL